MTIIYPDQHKQYFDEIKNKIFEAPLTIAELCCLQNLLEQRLMLERYQQNLFVIDGKERDRLRDQFFVLCQALELDAIQVVKLFADRDQGALKWHIKHRNKLVDAVLILTADDIWGIEPFPMSDSRLGIMTPKKRQDTADFGNLSLAIVLRTHKVDLEGLGGWKVAR